MLRMAVMKALIKGLKVLRGIHLLVVMMKMMVMAVKKLMVTIAMMGETTVLREGSAMRE